MVNTHPGVERQLRFEKVVICVSSDLRVRDTASSSVHKTPRQLPPPNQSQQYMLPLACLPALSA
eukprot:m.24550 g.24550  ORF g.24550 m.24550 type:complete len:64 (-) comp7533_c0_seq1:572-763(-)